MNNVCLLPSKHVLAYPHYNAQTIEYSDLGVILSSADFTDERLAGYYSTHGFYRYNSNRLNAYLAKGIHIVMNYMFIDIDTVPHEPWKDLDRGLEILTKLCEIFRCWGYLTAKGMRIIFKLSTPIRVADYRAYTIRIIKIITGCLVGNFAGLAIDEQSPEWDRLYVAPKLGPQYSVMLDENFELNENNLTVEMPIISVDSFERVEVPLVIKQAIEEAIGSEAFNLIYEGKPFFGQSERNAEMYRILKQISHIGPCTANMAVSFIYESLKNYADGTPFNDSLKEAVSQANRIWQNRSEYLPKKEVTSEHLPMLVFCDKLYFVLNAFTDNYLLPITNTVVIPNMLESYCRPLQPNIYNEETGKYLPLTYITRKYGKHVENVGYHIGAKTSHIEDRTLHIGTCYPKDIPAEFNLEIDTWLRKIAGDSQERFLDWLATFRRLDKVTSAVYIKADTGIGKGMLMTALASFFGAAPLTFSEVVRQFNARMAYMPLIVIDEGEDIPLNLSPSNKFKKLTGNVLHSAEKKFGDVISIHGAIRFLIIANNYNALPLSDAKTQQDINAICERVFFMDSTKSDAAKYLAELGGYTYTHGNGWVTENRIVKHIVWLEQNREVELGVRFMVQGPRTAWHEKVTMSKFKQDCFRALITACGRSTNWITSNDDYFWFLHKELHSNWSSLVGKQLNRSIEEVKSVFTEIAEEEVKKLNGKAHRMMKISKKKLAELAEILDVSLQESDD